MPRPWPKPDGARRVDVEMFSTPPLELELGRGLCSTAKFITGALVRPAKAGTSVSIIEGRSAAAGSQDALRFSRLERPLHNAHDRKWLQEQTLSCSSLQVETS